MDDENIRLMLQDKLAAAFPDLIIYFRPPGNTKLSRPHIVYEPKRDEPVFANNEVFTMGIRFQVTLVSDIPGYNKRPMYSLSGVSILSHISYVSEDIVHDVFNISVNSIT